MRLERLQIDEQLRQIGVGYRAAPSRSGSGVAGERERGYLTDESTNSVQTTRTYGGRGRGRKPNNAYSGYGETTTPMMLLCLEQSIRSLSLTSSVTVSRSKRRFHKQTNDTNTHSL